jgi:hypothetical protein
VLTTTRQGYGSRVAFTTGVWSARLEEPCTAERVPETATGPTETPASCRSVAEVSFANGGFVARTRFGVFGQAMSRYGSRTLRRSFVRKGVGVHKEPHERVEGCLPTRRNSLPARRHPTPTGPARSGIHPSAWNGDSPKFWPSTADCDDIDPYARHRHTPRCDYALTHGSEPR